MHFLSFLINTVPSECQTVWTQIRTDGPNCLQLLLADYFLLLSLAGKKDLKINQIWVFLWFGNGHKVDTGLDKTKIFRVKL